MAKKKLPDPLKKREILYSEEISAEEKTEWGRAFLEEGFVSDALAFFAEALSEPDLIKMRDRAIEEGDTFMLRAIGRAMPELVTKGRWEALARTAAAQGKEPFAEQAEAGGEVEMPVVDAVIVEDPTQHNGEQDDADGGETEE